MKFLLLVVVDLWLACAPGMARGDSALRVEESLLTVQIGGRSHSMEALIVKPAASVGRLPIALITHGSPRDPAGRAKYRARFMLPQARDLAHRGWLVVAVMRRGFGASEGPFAEGYTCAAPDFGKALDTAAQDIEAVRRAIAERSDADATRVLGLGVSVGGAAMLAWAATRPKGLVGVVNISGGSGAFKPENNCDEDRLVSTFAAYGARSPAPTLWLYAENDSYFGPGLVRRLHGAYTREGGEATLALFGSVGRDGHQLWDLFAGRALWLPTLDQFLRAQNLSTWDSRPIDALASRLPARERAAMARYLSAPGEKALSVSRVKRKAWFWAGSADIHSARQKSLEGCERDSAERCDVLVENFDVTPARGP